MPRRLFAIVVTSFLLILPARAADTSDRESDTAIAWGRPKDGLVVGLSMEPWYFPTPAPPRLRLYLKNTGTANIEGIVLTPTQAIIALNGEYYGARTTEGKNSFLPPGRTYGPLSLSLSALHPLPRLAPPHSFPASLLEKEPPRYLRAGTNKISAYFLFGPGRDQLAQSGELTINAPAVVPTARDLKTCPFGHRTLKEVPILYGLLIFDKEMERSFAHRDFVLGGCEVGPTSPLQEVFCTTCEFTYSIFSTDEPKNGNWSLSVTDPAKLYRPLSAIWRDFPFAALQPPAATITYSNDLDRKRTLTRESITIDYKGSLPSLRKILDPWLALHPEITSHFYPPSDDSPGWVSLSYNP